MMPAFSRCDRDPPVTLAVGVVPADVGDDRDDPVGDVGGVVPPEHPDLDDGDVDGDVGEPRERRCSQQLEVTRRVLEQWLDLGQLADDLGEAPRR